MRMLATVYTNDDPQPSNPNQVMVIMFSVELGAVDERISTCRRSWKAAASCSSGEA